MDWIVQVDIQPFEETDQYRLIAYEQDKFDGESSYWILHPPTTDIEHLKSELYNIQNFNGPGCYKVNVQNLHT